MIDFIFHLAASEVGDKTPEQDLNVNSVSVLHMLNTCVEKKCNPRIIFSSSTNIFGDANIDIVNENTKDNPSSEWSAHKLLSEHYLRIYSNKYGLKTVVLRLPNVYGPAPNKDAMDRMVINKVIRYGIENKKLKLYNNRGCYRDYVFIDDIVNAFMKIGLVDDKFFDGRFFVVGTKTLTTISDVWNIIASEIGKVSISLDNSTDLNLMEMRSFGGDYSKLNEITEWKPNIGLETGISITTRDLINIKKQ